MDAWFNSLLLLLRVLKLLWTDVAQEDFLGQWTSFFPSPTIIMLYQSFSPFQHLSQKECKYSITMMSYLSPKGLTSPASFVICYVYALPVGLVCKGVGRSLLRITFLPPLSFPPTAPSHPHHGNQVLLKNSGNSHNELGFLMFSSIFFLLLNQKDFLIHLNRHF